jgi:hypothetical protein
MYACRLKRSGFWRPVSVSFGQTAEGERRRGREGVEREVVVVRTGGQNDDGKEERVALVAINGL